MQRALQALAILPLLACRTEVSRQVLAEETTAWSEYCSTLSFCCVPGLDFDGEFRINCGLQSCPGSRIVHGTVRTVLITYDDGSTWTGPVRAQELETDRGIGECR